MIVFTFAMCSSMVSNHITMSSRYMWHIFPINRLSTLVTHHWWIAGEFRKPIGITHHSYVSKGVDTAVLWMSSGCTHV